MANTATEPTAADAETLPRNAVVVMAHEGEQTSDNRVIDQGAIDTQARVPLPVTMYHDDERVAGYADPVGRVSSIAGLTVDNLPDRLSDTGDWIVGLATFDLGYDAQGNLQNPDADGREAARMAEGGFLTGASIEPSGDAEITWECLAEDEEGFCTQELMHLVSAKLRAVSLVPSQAIQSATVPSTGTVAEPVAASARPAWAWPCPDPNATPVTAAAVEGMPALPPMAAFMVEEPDEYMPLTVDGWRVYGHIAPWDVCHVGIARYCQTTPRSRTNYSVFHAIPLETDDGILDVGLLVTSTLHGDLYDRESGRAVDAYTAQRRMFEDPRSRAGWLRASEGVHGVWVCGVLHPQISTAQLQDLEATPVSGHWAPVKMADGRLVGQELLVVNCVNVAGLPRIEAAVAASADGGVEVIAIRGPLGPHPSGCGCGEHTAVAASAMDQDTVPAEARLARLEHIIARSGLAEKVDAEDLDELAALIGA